MTGGGVDEGSASVQLKQKHIIKGIVIYFIFIISRFIYICIFHHYCLVPLTKGYLKSLFSASICRWLHTPDGHPHRRGLPKTAAGYQQSCTFCPRVHPPWPCVGNYHQGQISWNTNTVRSKREHSHIKYHQNKQPNARATTEKKCESAEDQPQEHGIPISSKTSDWVCCCSVGPPYTWPHQTGWNDTRQLGMTLSVIII